MNMKKISESKPAIVFNKVQKRYYIRHEKHTISNIFYEADRWFYALDNIDLIIRKGERVGIVGPNGSGKTTILKLLTGVTKLTAGNIYTDGKIVSIIGLGAGFNLELSGVDNIYLDGMLLGMSRQEIDARLKDIIAFSEIGEFINVPLRTYSQGMMMRLGFSIALHTRSDIFLLDEGFDTGDKEFKSKIRAQATKLFKNNTVVFVSHNLYAMSDFCDRIIHLDKGRIVYDGGIEGIIRYDPTIQDEFIMYLKLKKRSDHLNAIREYLRTKKR